jgi:hypothetical protein
MLEEPGTVMGTTEQERAQGLLAQEAACRLARRERGPGALLLLLLLPVLLLPVLLLPVLLLPVLLLPLGLRQLRMLSSRESSRTVSVALTGCSASLTT